MLSHLSQRIATQRLLIAGTYRPADVERSGHPLKNYKAEMQAHSLCDELALWSWNREHIAEYVDATFSPNDFPLDLTSLIQEKTEGHPLFAANLLQYLGECGDLSRVNGRWTLVRPLSEMDLAVPESVRAMIGKKMDALDPEERHALQYASVEGTEFLSSVVAALLGVDEIDLEESLARVAKSHRLIDIQGEEELPDGTLATRYRFSHALYQNFLYTDLVNKRRVMLHRQAGEQLLKHYGKRAPQIATQLAIHFEQGRDFARAIEYLNHAGDHAARLYGYAEAEEHYSRALNLVEKLPDAEQPSQFATLYHKRGTVNHALSNFIQAAKDFEDMLKQARVLDSLELQSTALNALTMTLFFSHRLDEMASRANEALELAEKADSEKLKVETMFLIGLKHLCYGELKEAKVLLDEVVATSRKLNHKPGLCSGLTWRACLHFFQTEYALATTAIDEALRLASELRDGFLMLTCFFFLGLSQGNQGKMSAALTTLNEALEKARRNGDLFWHPRFPNCIGWIYRELFDFESAHKHNEDGIEVARRCQVLEAEANSLINRGIDCIHAGAHQQTATTFHEVKDIFERDAWFRWRYNIRFEAAMAEHWLTQGDVDKASKHVERLYATATDHEVHKYIAVAHQLRAKVAIANNDLVNADKHFDEALAELARYPAPLVTWKVHAGRARLKSQLGDIAGAREASTTATEIVNFIAANVNDEKLRDNFLKVASTDYTESA